MSLLEKATIITTPTAHSNGVLHSIKGGSVADFDVVRGSSATRVNAEGLIEDIRVIGDEEVTNGSFSQEGVELVTNGSFDTDSDWTLSGGATISDGKANIVGDGSVFTNISQGGVFTNGKQYVVKLDVIINSGLGLKFQDGANNENIGFATTSGTYTFNFTATSNSYILIGRRTGGTPFNSSIDNVSCVEVGQDWTLGTGWSIGEDKAEFDGVSNANLTQSNILTNGKQYKLTYEILENTTTSGYIRLGAETATAITQLDGAVGTHEMYFLNDGYTTSFVIRTNSLTGGDFSITNISVIEIIDATNIPRIDYTDGTASVLLEPQSTNLVTYSEDFSQWNVISTPTVTSNYGISPDGTQNADRLQMNTNDRIYTSLSVSGNTAFSVYLKGSGIVTLRDSSNAYRQDVILTSEWERYSLYFNDTSNTVQIQNQKVGDVDCEIWGAQVEALPYATSYIPTSGAVATRLADTLTGAGSTDLINSTEGVLYAEIAALANDGTYRSISISDSSRTNIIEIDYTNDEKLRILVKSANVVIFSELFVLDITIYTKLAVKYKLNDFEVFINGIKEYTITNGATPIGLSELAFDRGDGGTRFFGKTKCVAVFKEALTDEELTCLTTI